MKHTPEPAIVVDNVHKDFVLPQHRNSSLKHLFVNFLRGNKKARQHVLDGVSFHVNQGDFFGIVGRNGSGKSTLLKILAGVYSPTEGSIWLDGKLTPFIELGVGFNPELSGRDNIFLNGALLGFTHKQMETMYDDIVEFAELEQFMDQKLKNYSSGMQVRLAFSIAIKAKNDILIFDEVLAVGDEAFQRKCLDVFERYKAEGQTVVLVTHDMETVRQYCNRAILIHNGKIIEDGSPRLVAEKYSELNQVSIDQSVSRANEDDSEAPMRVRLLNKQGSEDVSFAVDDELRLHITWPGLEDVRSVGVNIFKESGEHVTGANTLQDGFDVRDKTAIDFTVKLPLQPGKYRLLIEAFRKVGERVGAIETHAPRFVVKKADVAWSGMVELPHTWHIDKKK